MMTYLFEKLNLPETQKSRLFVKLFELFYEL
ncbi:hypothetical protein ES703_19147 [subsurface metagenome]